MENLYQYIFQGIFWVLGLGSLFIYTILLFSSLVSIMVCKESFYRKYSWIAFYILSSVVFSLCFVLTNTVVIVLGGVTIGAYGLDLVLSNAILLGLSLVLIGLLCWLRSQSIPQHKY
jgi:hypothetical protein